MTTLLKFPLRGTVVEAFSASKQLHGLRITSVRHTATGRLRYSDVSSNGDSENRDDSVESKQVYQESSSSFPPHAHSLSNGRLKYRLRHGLPLTGVVTGQYRDTDHVEQLGLLGYDFLWADCEHSSGSPDHVLNLILAAERRGMPTLVRIGYGYQNIIGHAQKYLVAGAQGILLPQCESKEDVEKVVQAVKFPPIGLRGLAGERWNAWGMAQNSHGMENNNQITVSIADCVKQSNRNSVVGVLVETQRGLDALEDMLSIEELDLVFLAPTDLSSDLGVHGQIRHPRVLQLVEDTVHRIARYNQGERVDKRGWHPVAVGTLAVSLDDYVYWRDRNVPVLCGVAQCMFVDGAKGFMDTVRDYQLGDGMK